MKSNSLITEKVKTWLKDVERYGIKKTRYDELNLANTWESKKYNDTKSVFTYEYTDNDIAYYVVIFKERGEFTDYFKRVI